MIDAIVLAAGRSLRMRTQKLLLPFAGQTVIGHVVDQVLSGAVHRAVVVVGRGDSAVRSALAGKAVTFVENPDPQAEMLSSVRCGLRALAADASAALVVLGDQPAVRPEGIAQLITAFRATRQGIIAPVYGGKRGHPLLIAARYFEPILTSYDDVGLRGLLAAHPADVLEVPASDDSVLSDMDYPDDYRRELARFGAMG
jgi:molybdenum cofactor cytidylyltransferase